MSEQTYDIYFRGEALENADINTVKTHFAKLFKADDAKIAQLFSGKVIPLKKNLIKADAAKFQQLFKKAGAKIYIKAAETETTSPAPTPTPTSAPAPAPLARANEDKSEAVATASNQQTQDQQVSPTAGPEAINPSPNERPPVPAGSTEAPQTIPKGVHPVNMDEINFDVLPPGSDILKDSERAEVVVADIDISAINLASVFDTTEVEQIPPPPAPDVSHLSAAEAGSNLSEGINKEPVPEAPSVDHISVAETGSNIQDVYDDIPDIPPDTDHISLAAPGSDLEQIKEEKEIKVPDISHIKLEN